MFDDVQRPSSVYCAFWQLQVMGLRICLWINQTFLSVRMLDVTVVDRISIV